MNKGRLKEFAIWGRKELIEKIEERLALLGITEKEKKELPNMGSEVETLDEVLVNKKYYDELIRKYKELGYKELVEESAYTWFNRLVAFAYMEINEYYDEKMIISTTSKETPDILDKFIEANFFQKLQDEEKEEIFKLQDEHKLEELYARLVDYKDKELSTIMPFMFRKDLDYLMLLFPKNILMKDSFISKLSKEIQDVKVEYEEIVPVEIIGWLYQYYNSDKREVVYDGSMKKSKITKEYLAPATQLFTPDWIVKYIVENTLGRFALERLGVRDNLKNNWKFYIEPQEGLDYSKESKVEKIKILDPAMGSGHILTYSFDLLYDIYNDLGWSTKDAVLSIIENNICGLEIDNRAGMLAAFTVLMKGREKFKRLFKVLEKREEKLDINIIALKESNSVSNQMLKIIEDNKLSILIKLIELFEDAKEYGSIIKLEDLNKDQMKLELEELNKVTNNQSQLNLMLGSSDFSMEFELIKDLTKQYEVMQSKYDLTIENPPYMGNARMNAKLKKYIDKNYKEVKSDLFSVFFVKSCEMTKEDGYLGFMSPFVWMFIKSYENLREYFIKKKTITSLIQLEYSGFEDATVPICTFTLQNKTTKKLGEYIKLSDFKGAKNQPIKTLEAIKNPECGWRYQVNQKDFEKIPGSPIAYWVSDIVKEIFEKSEKLGDIGDAKVGLQTGDNDKFLRLWNEVNFKKVGFNMESSEKALESKMKWFPYNKGGEKRKWYGNQEYLINWYNDGYEIKNFKNSVVRNPGYYFKKSISWSDITSSGTSFRNFQNGFIHDVTGMSYFYKTTQEKYRLLGILNNKFIEIITGIINPTLHLQIGDFIKLPNFNFNNNKFNELVEQNIKIAKEEWDSRETSWDFESLGVLNGSSLEEGINNYCSEWKEKFYQMHKNEEELNRIFIDIYELQNEMDEFVDINNITLLKNELLKENKKLVLDENNEIVFNKEELIKQFLSYVVGCIMGRYSLDKKGLIIANSDDNLVINKNSFEIKDNEGERRHKIENPKFIPDEFGIIPITNTKIFENDIVDMVIKFVKASFGEENLEENLKFIGDILNKNGNSSRETIRNYFIKDFYTDHLKRYKKRPIYWMLSSGKTNSFQALVYMHRYEENTVGRIRTDYLNRYQEAIEMQKKYFENQSENEELSPKERKNADKELKKISTEEKELTIYANNVKHIAEKRISIDLDDGVKVNYGKFKEILKKI